MDQVNDIIKILNMGQGEAIIKGVLLIIALVFLFVVHKIVQKQKIEQARRTEETNAQNDRGEVRDQNNQQTTEIQTDSEASDDFFKEE